MYDRLVTHFSTDRVFRDLDSLPIGKPFPQALDEAVITRQSGPDRDRSDLGIYH